MNPTNIVLSDNTYDKIKKATQVFLPALATLYFALSQIWGLPFGEELLGTLAAFETFLGVTLGISSRNYEQNKYMGTAVEMIDEETGEASLGIKFDPDADVQTLTSRGEITFKVDRG